MDEAVNALQAAYGGLEKVQAEEPEDPGTGTGSQSGSTASGQNGQNSPNGQEGNTGSGTDKAAKTGDSAPVAAAGILFVLSAGAAVITMKKKTEK